MGRSVQRFVSAVLVGLLATGGQIPVALGQTAAGTAGIRGRLFWEEGGEPIAGATVHCIHLDTKQVMTSEPSASDGSYALTNLPFGYYDCAVSTPRGLCLANRVVNVPAGETVEISMVIGAPNPEDTEWWSADSTRKLPGLNQVPDSVCRIFEGSPKKLPRPAAKETPAAAAAGGAHAAWLVPALAAGGLVALLALLNDDHEDARDTNATPF